jgi:ABC-type Zn2+ transport system substrate-binding protein/surface adhesin
LDVKSFTDSKFRAPAELTAYEFRETKNMAVFLQTILSECCTQCVMQMQCMQPQTILALKLEPHTHTQTHTHTDTHAHTHTHTHTHKHTAAPYITGRPNADYMDSTGAHRE